MTLTPPASSSAHPYFSEAQCGVVGRETPSPLYRSRFFRVPDKIDVPLGQIGIANREPDFELGLIGDAVVPRDKLCQRLFQHRCPIVRSCGWPVTDIDDHSVDVFRIGKGQDVSDAVDDIGFEPHPGRIANTILGELNEHDVGGAGGVIVGAESRRIFGILANTRRGRDASGEHVRHMGAVRFAIPKRAETEVRIEACWSMTSASA